MKKYIFLSTVILIFSVFALPFIPSKQEAAIYSDVVRFHILAKSDTAEDQNLKIAVRDAVLATYGEELSACNDIADAEATITDWIPLIQRTAEETLANCGCFDEVTVALRKEEYERRRYSAFTLPAGEYLSLSVTIGDGNGQNWWCVLFPPLCTEAAYGYEYDGDALPVGLTPEEYRLITGDGEGYAVKLKLLKIMAELFS